MNSRLPRLAAALLAAAEIPWIWSLCCSGREMPRGLVVWNAAVILVILATAVFLWLGGRRAAGHVLLVCYYNLAYSVFWAVQQRMPVLWFSGIASAGAALLLVEWRRRRPEPAPPPPPPSASSPSTPLVVCWLKENVEALVVAFIMALVIRCFCIEVFKIPSSSMQPTLMGDQAGSRSGDRIMVTKFYYTAAEVERFDVVVFKFPLNQAKNFIKRVVGLPGEWLQVLHGDIFVRPRGETEFHIARKTLRTQDSVWIDAIHATEPPAYLAGREAFEEYWAPQPVSGARHASYAIQDGRISTQEWEGARGVQFNFKHKILNSRQQPTGDLRLAFEFEATSPGGEMFAEIANEMGRFEARLPLNAPGTLSHYARGRENAPPVRTVPFRVPRLALDRSYAFDLSIFDGKAYVRLDDEVQADITFLESPQDVQPPRRAEISFGSRDLTFRMQALSLRRDIHYLDGDNIGEGDPIEIPADHYVMMGDNVGNSHDSRAWTKRTFRIRGVAEPVACEAMEVKVADSDLREIEAKYRLDRRPDLAVKADLFGNERFFYNDQIEREEKQEAFPFVHRRFIVGKAFLVWWPTDRWFRLIR